MTQAYPLDWPPGVARTAPEKRQTARFAARKVREGSFGSWYTSERLTLAAARDRVLVEIDKFTKPGRDWRSNPELAVISSNVPLRLDGLPRSGARAPDDPGIAVYFTLDGAPQCVPVDRWDRVADNLAAAAAIIGAIRGIERWGNDGMVSAAFRGFAALPEHVEPTWRQVLDLVDVDPVTPVIIDVAYRRLARQHHPDRGGTHEQMSALNEARARAHESIAP